MRPLLLALVVAMSLTVAAAPPAAAHLAPCDFGDLRCFVGCIRDHARDPRTIDCAMEGPL